MVEFEAFHHWADTFGMNLEWNCSERATATIAPRRSTSTWTGTPIPFPSAPKQNQKTLDDFLAFRATNKPCIGLNEPIASVFQFTKWPDSLTVKMMLPKEVAATTAIRFATFAKVDCIMAFLKVSGDDA
jgi:hypothetical protein